MNPLNPLEFLQSLIAQHQPFPADPGMPGLAAPLPLPGPAPVDVAGKTRRTLGATADSGRLAGVVPPAPEPMSPSGQLWIKLKEFLTGPSQADRDEADAFSETFRPMPPQPPVNIPDPEGAALAKSMDRRLAPPPGTTIGAMPRPTGPMSPAAVKSPTFPGEMAGGPWLTSAQSAPSPAQSPAPAAAGGFGEFLASLQKNPVAIGLRDILGSAMAGAATAQGPRAGNIGALGQGYTAAQKAIDTRTAAEAARQKAALEQTLALRKDSRDERGANRSDEELGLKKSEQGRKDRESEARARKYDAEAKKLATELSVKSGIPGLSMKDAQKLNDQINLFADRIKPFVTSADEMKKLMTTERDRLLRDYLPQQQGMAGNGASKEAPAKPASKSDFDALPSGSFFINPADGRILQKK